MELGFSTLSLFMKSTEEMLQIAEKHEFQMIELLCEGPYSPKYLLENKKELKPLKESQLEICIHAPNVDLNIASLNSGIRQESVRQIKETVDLAREINGTTITLHPGQIGRNEERIRKVAMSLSKESVAELTDYGKENGVIISVENMPERFSFLGNRIEELEEIQKETGCNITVDTGHANTCNNTSDFFNLKHISYFHINDNNGLKDQHLPLGEGTLDLKLVEKIDRGILELNTFEKVLKSKEVIKNL